MKTLAKIFGNPEGKADHKKVVDYYGHGTHNIKSHASRLDGKYRCPMGCEGEKTYDSPGNCPVCNMKLVPVRDENMHTHHHHGM